MAEEFVEKSGELDLSELGDLGLGDVDAILPESSAPTTDAGKAEQTHLGEVIGQGIDTFVDIVFCIDVTGSMGPIINTVKNLTLELYDDLVANMRDKCQRIVKQLRVRVIAFRDYYCDGSYAMDESEFFTLPDDNAAFRRYVEALKADGGGDEPENALEAMALAMKSDWVRVSDTNTQKARNVIVLFTDASAHPLEKAADGVPSNYPSDMLKSYNDLYEAWCGQGSSVKGSNIYNMDKMAKRLVVFAPEDSDPWSNMAEEFDNLAVVPISAADGGQELGKNTIIATISGSMR